MVECMHVGKACCEEKKGLAIGKLVSNEQSLRTLIFYTEIITYKIYLARCLPVW